MHDDLIFIYDIHKLQKLILHHLFTELFKNVSPLSSELTIVICNMIWHRKCEHWCFIRPYNILYYTEFSKV